MLTDKTLDKLADIPEAAAKASWLNDYLREMCAKQKRAIKSGKYFRLVIAAALAGIYTKAPQRFTSKQAEIIELASAAAEKGVYEPIFFYADTKLEKWLLNPSDEGERLSFGDELYSLHFSLDPDSELNANTPRFNTVDLDCAIYSYDMRLFQIGRTSRRSLEAIELQEKIGDNSISKYKCRAGDAFRLLYTPLSSVLLQGASSYSILTEGAKKALASAIAGVPAISSVGYQSLIPLIKISPQGSTSTSTSTSTSGQGSASGQGSTSGQGSASGQSSDLDRTSAKKKQDAKVLNYYNQLREVEFLISGRNLVIAYDRDSDPKLQLEVTYAAARLARWFKQELKVNTKISHWDGSVGKGLDDYLSARVKQGITSGEVIAEICTEALDPAEAVNRSADMFDTTLSAKALAFNDQTKTLYEAEAVEDVLEGEFRHVVMHSPYLEVNKIVDALGDDLGAEAKYIVGVRSPKGSGKSIAVDSLMRKIAAGSRGTQTIFTVISLSTDAQFKAQRYGINLHRPEVVDLDNTKCLVQVTYPEALHSHFKRSLRSVLQQGADRHVIIIDEFEAILGMCLSSSHLDPHQKARILVTLYELVQRADVAIFLSADLHLSNLQLFAGKLEVSALLLQGLVGKSVDLFKFILENKTKLQQRVLMFTNTYDRYAAELKAVERTYDAVDRKAHLLTQVSTAINVFAENPRYSSEALWVTCNTKTFAEEIFQQLPKHLQEVTILATGATKQAAEDEAVIRFFQDPNAVISEGKYRIFLVSPAMSEGVDVSLEGKVRQIVAVSAFKGILPVKLEQMIARVRKPIAQHIFYVDQVFSSWDEAIRSLAAGAQVSAPKIPKVFNSDSGSDRFLSEQLRNTADALRNYSVARKLEAQWLNSNKTFTKEFAEEVKASDLVQASSSRRKRSLQQYLETAEAISKKKIATAYELAKIYSGEVSRTKALEEFGLDSTAITTSAVAAALGLNNNSPADALAISLGTSCANLAEALYSLNRIYKEKAFDKISATGSREMAALLLLIEMLKQPYHRQGLKPMAVAKSERINSVYKAFSESDLSKFAVHSIQVLPASRLGADDNSASCNDQNLRQMYTKLVRTALRRSVADLAEGKGTFDTTVRFLESLSEYVPTDLGAYTSGDSLWRGFTLGNLQMHRSKVFSCAIPRDEYALRLNLWVLVPALAVYTKRLALAQQQDYLGFSQLTEGLAEVLQADLEFTENRIPVGAGRQSQHQSAEKLQLERSLKQAASKISSEAVAHVSEGNFSTAANLVVEALELKVITKMLGVEQNAQQETLAQSLEFTLTRLDSYLTSNEREALVKIFHKSGRNNSTVAKAKAKGKTKA